jgi:hypothetical protein
MSAEGIVQVRVSPAMNSDAEELASLTRRLRAELLQLDVDSVRQGAPEEDAPADPLAKGAGFLASAGHWLVVQLGAVGIRTVLTSMADWVTRNNREVEVGVTVGSDVRTLKLSRVTPEQQEMIIDAWIASLPPVS